MKETSNTSPIATEIRTLREAISQTKQPRVRKLTLTEKLIALTFGLFSLVFYGSAILIFSGASHERTGEFILKTIGIVAFLFTAPAAVVFRQISERYCKKQVIDNKGGYTLDIPGRPKWRKMALCISGGLVVGGAAWSFVGLFIYSALSFI